MGRLKRKIAIIWWDEDVLGRAKERGIKLTRKDACEILRILEHGHDANLGLTWDTIDVITDQYLEDKK